ncbi:MAG: vWA domain-containing protein [Candidatus Bathyarchaeota archaeon]|nr:vWA domain-containing protein [Candidatus Bathyarchaeota archaeon]
MNFFDFAWSTVTQITKKSHNELKILLHDDLRYPYLGKDIRGFVLHLIKPKRLSEKCVYFHGLKFDLQNPTHKKIIWYLFKSSVYHLALHSHLSDFSVYSKWAQGKSHNLSTFVISLIEDAIINEHLKRSFRWMLPEIAYANAISFLLMKDIDKLPNDISQAMASILQEYALGKVKGKLKDDVLMDVKAITSILRGIRENLTEDSRVDAANKIYDALTVYGEPFEVPSLLHAECHGTNDLFYEQHIPREEDIQPIFTDALNIFESESKSEAQLQNLLQSLKEGESHQVLTTWQEQERSKLKILKDYAQIGKDTPFEDFEFPAEDYAEFQRRRELLGSPIRRIMHQLRLLKNVEGEDFRQESGFVDLQEAIQVIASKSQRTDIFVREELQTREDTWSILIDASHSLNMFKGEVRGIALCLAEVAKTLILNQNSWGMYAFNNKFYVIKDFSERFNAQVKARIGGLTHGGLTYLPDAVLLAAQALTKKLETAKVLVIVSDFFPSGYDGAEEKLKENLKKIERMGVGVIGIGVKSRAVKNYIRVNCVVENPYDLMKKFTKAFIEFSVG